MLQQENWLLPEGIEEVLPADARRLEGLRRSILDMLATWGYELVIPPFIEFIDSLLTGTGSDLDLQTFKLIDQVSGRMLGVRADMTPQVARIDAHTLRRDQPTRLCYLGTVLHTSGDHLDRSRSPMQVGAELYGHAGIESDFEILRLMLELLAISGLQDIHIDLGHVGIFRSLSNQTTLDRRQESELFDILQRKAASELNEFFEHYQLPEDMREMLACLPNLNGQAVIMERAREKLARADASVFAALDDLEKIAAKLRKLFPSLKINFDLAELRGYHYQTGIVFAAFAPGYGREIARGGRYDDIGRVFGRARPATGFSADLKVLARLSRSNGESETNDRIYAPCGDDMDLQEIIKELRTSGRTVIQELPGQQSDSGDIGCLHRLVRENDRWEIVDIE